MNAPTSNGFLMGLDAGTSVVKAAIFDQAGNEMSRGARTVPIVNPQPHLAEEDMDLVWEAAAGAIQDALVNGSVRAEEILGVCATGQGDGSWMVGSDGKPAGPAILWTDGRTGDLLDQWYDSGAVAKQFPISGTGPYAGTTSALLRWRQDNEPSLLARATPTCGARTGWSTASPATSAPIPRTPASRASTYVPGPGPRTCSTSWASTSAPVTYSRSCATPPSSAARSPATRPA